MARSVSRDRPGTAAAAAEQCYARDRPRRTERRCLTDRCVSGKIVSGNQSEDGGGLPTDWGDDLFRPE